MPNVTSLSSKGVSVIFNVGLNHTGASVHLLFYTDIQETMADK
jgi:hypothetical protein